MVQRTGRSGKLEAGGHGRGERVAHRGESVRLEEAERLVARPGLGRDGLDGADVGGEDRVARHERAERSSELIARESPWPSRRTKRPVEPLPEARADVGFPLEPASCPAQERGECRPHLAHRLLLRPELSARDRHGTDRDERPRVMPELVGLDGIEAEADEEVGALEELEHHAVAGHPRADAAEERVVLGEQALGLGRDEHRSPQPGYELSHRGHVLPRVEVEAQDHGRAPRAREGARHALDRLGRRGWDRRGLDGDRRDASCRAVGLSRHVAGQRDVHRSHSRRDRGEEGPPHLRLGVLAVEAERVLREGPVDGVQVELLMRGVGQGRARQGGRDGEDGRAIEKGVGHSQRHVDGARPQGGHADAGTTLDLPGHVGHESRRRLVAGEEEADPDAARRFQEVQDLPAGQAEHAGDAGLPKRAREHVGARGHRGTIACGND